jgi:hypothetical protein
VEYNSNWTREKHIEYRKLKKSGYSTKELLEYFGDDIYYSGIYNRDAGILPFKVFNKIAKNLNEIKINPEEVYYYSIPTRSDIYKNKWDNILVFESENVEYVVVFMYFIINKIDTWNIIFTTRTQWDNYKSTINKFKDKGYITNDEYDILNNIISDDTGLDNLFSVMKKLSYIILDFYNTNLKGSILSIGDTNNPIKIRLYNNIIIDSFKDIKKEEVFDNDGNRYYLYSM